MSQLISVWIWIRLILRGCTEVINGKISARGNYTCSISVYSVSWEIWKCLLMIQDSAVCFWLTESKMLHVIIHAKTVCSYNRTEEFTGLLRHLLFKNQVKALCVELVWSSVHLYCCVHSPVVSSLVKLKQIWSACHNLNICSKRRQEEIFYLAVYVFFYFDLLPWQNGFWIGILLHTFLFPLRS